MTGVGIRLIGGPADGRDFIIPGDPMNPPQTYEIMHASLGQGARRLTYSREANLEDDGPLWFYRYTSGRAA
jgi:hypothetical protein